eukprot:scaffold23926_cov183-Skeletonema_dohrnii-CCMP3373.AAC.1
MATACWASRQSTLYNTGKQSCMHRKQQLLVLACCRLHARSRVIQYTKKSNFLNLVAEASAVTVHHTAYVFYRNGQEGEPTKLNDEVRLIRGALLVLAFPTH